jgi:5-formyltetrahydrofolate cyclo-ligase
MKQHNEIRRALCQQRRRLDAPTRMQAARALCQQIITNNTFKRAQHIAAYWAVGGEMALDAIIQAAWAQHKTVYLPVLAPWRVNRLYFMPYRPATPMHRNRFGIPEPMFRPAEARPPRCLDLVLLPLVACDAHGNRLGMGGGFYDRTFAFRHITPMHRKPTLMGIGYTFQCVATLPSQSWDVKLDYFASDRGVIPFPNQT